MEEEKAALTAQALGPGEEVGPAWISGWPHPPPPPALGPDPGLFLAGTEFSCSLGNSSPSPGYAPAGLGEKPGRSLVQEGGEEGPGAAGTRRGRRHLMRKLRLRSGPKYELLVSLQPLPYFLGRPPGLQGHRLALVSGSKVQIS